MIEDQLSRDERIRLEALAQAVAAHTMKTHTPDSIISYAKKFEGWIRGAGQPKIGLFPVDMVVPVE